MNNIFLNLGIYLLSLTSPPDLSPWKVTLAQEIIGKKINISSVEKILNGRMMVLLDKTTSGIPYLVSAGTILDAPVEKVWETLVDFKTYKEYMPFVEKSEVIPTEDENVKDTDYSLVFRIAIIPFSIDFTIRNYFQPPKRFDWYATKGDLAEDYGFWELTPTTDGKKTIAFYSVFTRSGSSFINSILEKEPVLSLGFDIALASSVVRVVKERLEGKEAIFAEGRGIPWREMDRTTIESLVSKGALTVVGSGEGLCKPYVSSLVYINKDKGEVFNAVADYDNYHTFMPMVEKIKIISSKDNVHTVDYNIAFNFLLFKSRVWYRLLHTNNFPDSITWDLIKGDMDAVKGGWEFINETSSTLSIYSFCSNLRSVGFLMKFLLNRFPQLDTGIQVATGIVVTTSIKEWIESGKYQEVRTKEKKKEEKTDAPF